MSTEALTIPRTEAELLKLIQAKSTDPKVYEEYMAYAKKVEEALNLRKSLIAKIVEEITTNRVSINELRKAGLKISNASLSAEVEGSGDSAESAEDKVKREGNIVFGNDKFNWTRDLEVNAKNALFNAFKDGKSVKSFFTKPSDKFAVARLISRLERETADLDDKGKVKKTYEYSATNLTELGLTRASITKAVADKLKADRAKADKATPAKVKKA